MKRGEDEMSAQQGDLYWYFAREDKRLRYDDGREIMVGGTHSVDCKPVLCGRGLHASRRAIDALAYAPGPIVYRVELLGEIVHGDDKSVATMRKYAAGGVDVSFVLREFARKCALDVIHLWDAPQVVVDYLNTGNEAIRAAARDAAWAASRDAAWAAAWDAAWDAARDAALDAAWAAALDASRAAARDAALDAAWAAAWDAARDTQNTYLEMLLEKAIMEAK